MYSRQNEKDHKRPKQKTLVPVVFKMDAGGSFSDSLSSSNANQMIDSFYYYLYIDIDFFLELCPRMMRVLQHQARQGGPL